MPLSISNCTISTLKGEFFSPILAWVMDNRMASLMVTGAAGLQVGLTAIEMPGWTCPFLHVLGVPCPGCGLSRATVALVEGEWAAMFTLHAFAPLLTIALTLIAVGAILPDSPRHWLIGQIESVERRTGITALLLIALIGYWFIRLTLFPELFINLIWN